MVGRPNLLYVRRTGHECLRVCGFKDKILENIKIFNGKVEEPLHRFVLRAEKKDFQSCYFTDFQWKWYCFRSLVTVLQIYSQGWYFFRFLVKFDIFQISIWSLNFPFKKAVFCFSYLWGRGSRCVWLALTFFDHNIYGTRLLKWKQHKINLKCLNAWSCTC